MRISLAQVRVSNELERNLATVLSTIETEARRGADVVLFPETVLTGYLGFSFTDLSGLDPLAIHEAVWRVQDKCRQLSVAAVVGQYFKRGGRWFNNAVAVGKDGRIVASYDKCQLVDRDCYEVAPGDSFPVFEIDGVRCSMAICHDIRYPEILRQFGAQNVQVHLHLFYGARHRSDLRHQAQYDAHLVTRAVENGFVLAAANAALDEQMVRSQVRDTEGVALMKAAGWDQDLLLVEVDTAGAGDGWARKRRDDLFPALPGVLAPKRSFFERAVWEDKHYMINHASSLIADRRP